MNFSQVGNCISLRASCFVNCTMHYAHCMVYQYVVLSVVGGGGGDRAQMARVSSPLARAPPPAQHTAAQPLTLLSPVAEHCTELIVQCFATHPLVPCTLSAAVQSHEG